jgi:hypothetical protein
MFTVVLCHHESPEGYGKWFFSVSEVDMEDTETSLHVQKQLAGHSQDKEI